MNDLPKGWVETAIFEIAELHRGVTYKKNDSSQLPFTGSIPILRANNIDDGINFSDLVYVPSSNVSENQIMQDYDILIAMSSGSKNLVGKSAQLPYSAKEYSFGAFCSVLRSSASVKSSYVAFFLQSRLFRDLISQKSKGIGINNLKKDDVLNSMIPLPPLAEQKRIVEKIEALFSRLDAGIAALEKTKAQLKRYKQVIIMQAFTGKLSKTFREKQSLTRELLNSHILANKKGATKLLAKQQEKEELPEIPVEWIWSNIELVASDEKNSIKAGPFGSALKKEFYVENGYKIYGQEQVIRQNHEYGDYYIDEERYNSLLTCKVQPRDVLISLVGTIGKVLVLPDELEKGIINPRLIKITFNQNLMNPVFFKYYFESDFVRSVYRLQSHGATMDILNLSVIKSVPLPICSIEEQEYILKEIEKLHSKADKALETVEQELKKAQALKSKILEYAFTGKLVPQNPDDEPAEVLLERIKAEKEASQSTKKTRKRK